VPYLAAWSEDAASGTFEQIAAVVDRLARRLEEALGAEEREERQTAPLVA
jgi:nitrate reductase assembly molybdenum cofactor insertion protein NarJ